MIIIETYPEKNKSHIIRNNGEDDWAMDSLNSSVGKITQALLSDVNLNKSNKTYLKNWHCTVLRLLSLKDDLHRYAIVMLAYHINWLYLKGPKWVDDNILKFIKNGDQKDCDSFWAGFLWRGIAPHPELFKKIKSELIAISKDTEFSRTMYIDSLARVILSSWGYRGRKKEEYKISSEELRGALIDSTAEFRDRILWLFENAITSEDNEIKIHWNKQLKSFLNEVWPRQKHVKIGATSSKLCDLAFSNLNIFKRSINIIIPLIDTIDDQDFVYLPSLKSEEMDQILNKYPEKVLTVYHAILPEDSRKWPYDIGEFLELIGKKNEKLRYDPRLIELKRKWYSR